VLSGLSILTVFLLWLQNGLRDVIAAIRWLKTHLKAFGGDPDRITVMGESSGVLIFRILFSNFPWFM